MSLYNILHGVDDLAPILLKILDLDQPDGKFDTGRFRDIYLNEDGTKIILLTRNGGGNRDDYQNIFDSLEADHPNYITDFDDDFDSTYAYIEFSIPDQFKEDLKALATGKKPKNMFEKTNEAIAALDGKSPEEIKNEFPELTKILETIVGKLETPK